MIALENLHGMHIDTLAQRIGRTRQGARNWISSKGYRVSGNVLRAIPSPQQIDDEIKARPATRTSCFLCGARSCAHQGAE